VQKNLQLPQAILQLHLAGFAGRSPAVETAGHVDLTLDICCIRGNRRQQQQNDRNESEFIHHLTPNNAFFCCDWQVLSQKRACLSVMQIYSTFSQTVTNFACVKFVTRQKQLPSHSGYNVVVSIMGNSCTDLYVFAARVVDGITLC